MGKLSEFAMKNVVEDAVTKHLGANTKCADTPKVIAAPTSVLATCSVVSPPPLTCNTRFVVFVSCSA